jgi:hypothetical protein
VWKTAAAVEKFGENNQSASELLPYPSIYQDLAVLQSSQLTLLSNI